MDELRCLDQSCSFGGHAAKMQVRRAALFEPIMQNAFLSVHAQNVGTAGYAEALGNM